MPKKLTKINIAKEKERIKSLLQNRACLVFEEKEDLWFVCSPTGQFIALGLSLNNKIEQKTIEVIDSVHKRTPHGVGAIIENMEDVKLLFCVPGPDYYLPPNN